jgi:hypothetical protein
MMISRTQSFSLLTALLAAMAACGGDNNGSSGTTTLSGALSLPPPAQCIGCSVAQAPIQLLALKQNAAPTQLAASLTDAQGRYNFANADAVLGGQSNVIVVASVAQGAGLGGVEALSLGSSNDKNFDVTTQVACQASVYMTAGTQTAGDPGCVVRPTCQGEPNCLPTRNPTTLDDATIARLENAAAFIAGEVVLNTDVPRAACAVIDCTLSGLADANAECVTSSF